MYILLLLLSWCCNTKLSLICERFFVFWQFISNHFEFLSMLIINYIELSTKRNLLLVFDKNKLHLNLSHFEGPAKKFAMEERPEIVTKGIECEMFCQAFFLAFESNFWGTCDHEFNVAITSFVLIVAFQTAMALSVCWALNLDAYIYVYIFRMFHLDCLCEDQVGSVDQPNSF